MMMRKRLWLLLLLIPLAELYGFIWVSHWIGAGKTILLIILTTLIGAAMMQFEGRKVIADAKNEMNRGKCPAVKCWMDYVSFSVGACCLSPDF